MEKEIKGKRKAVIFDLDGTLWDSSKQVSEAWNTVFERRNEPIRVSRQDIVDLMGLPMDVIAKRIYPDEDNPAQKLAECEQYENEYLQEHGGVLYPKVREVLELLKQDYALMIVSNCQKGYIESFLKASGMEDLFDDFESYGNTLCYKDENIKMVMDRNHISDALYIGDIEGDFQASKNAGIPFIHAAYGFGKLNTDYKVENFDELPKVIQQIFQA